MSVELFDAWIASWKHDFVKKVWFLKGLEKKKIVGEGLYCLCLKVHAYTVKSL
jgi:hypothetical protein